MKWIETHGNPALKRHGVRVDLARFQALSLSSCQYGILVHTIVDEVTSTRSVDETEQQHPWYEISLRFSLLFICQAHYCERSRHSLSFEYAGGLKLKTPLMILGRICNSFHL